VGKFEVILVSEALKFYKHCPAGLSERLNKCFETLENNPFFGSHIKRLRDEERRHRYRIGDYRIIYTVDKEAKKFIVTLIAPKPSAYRGF
jgi:mRNA interferase RelE/StbE